MSVHTVANKAMNTGFEVLQRLEDETGTYGYRLARDGNEFYLVVKKYAYKDLASFMRMVVYDADAADAFLLFYQSDKDTTTVFNSRFVKRNGSPSRGQSKTKDTEWIELPLDHGVPLKDFLRNGKRPETLAGDSETLDEFL